LSRAAAQGLKEANVDLAALPPLPNSDQAAGSREAAVRVAGD
jgi:hypothetical protein